MLLVKTHIAPSTIHGTGLFADEHIPKGTLCWRFSSEVDTAYTKEEVEALPEPKRSEVLSLFHTWVNKKSGKYIVEGDNGRFANHSSSPNLIMSGEDFIAARDVENGEELTYDYREFANEGIDFEPFGQKNEAKIIM